MITVRRARPSDAAAIGAVHVAAWRSAYPGILPDSYLSGLSANRQARYYETTIRSGVSVHVATASGLDVGPAGGPPRIVGFITGSPAQARTRYGDGEIETLYVLDDWRERGLGRRLMRATASSLAGAGCGSVFVWVLRPNPSRWFYERLGGKAVAEAAIEFAGKTLMQTAYCWSPIESLVQATSSAT